MSEIDQDVSGQNGIPAREPDPGQQTSEEGGAGGAPASAEEATDSLQAEVNRLKNELDETRDRLLRQAAEFQNYRKRTAQERDTLVDLGKVFVIERMLEVKDDLDRTVSAVGDADRYEDLSAAHQALKQGVELVHRKLTDELSRLNVEPIEAEGQPFDENLHDAMMRQPAPEGTAPNTVLTEIQKGYRMGERVLRHSKVVVASEAEA